MKTIVKVVGTALLSLALLASCDPVERQIKQDFDRSGQEMRITVIFHDNLNDLNKAYRERFGNDGTKKLGFAVYANPGRQPYWCEIHTTRPKRTDDEPMNTMGHELAHCVFGQFHEKNRKGG